MNPPANTNFGGLAEPPDDDDDAVHGPYDGIGDPAVPSPRDPGARLMPTTGIPDPSTRPTWKPKDWPAAAQFGALEKAATEKAKDVVLLKKWIIWMRTEIKRQERLVNNYAPVKAAVLAGLPATVISLSISTWIAEALATKTNDTVTSMLVGMGLLFLVVYAGVWIIHEIPSRGGIHWWRSWRENAERLTMLENRLRSYEMRLEELTGGSSTGGE